MKKCKCGIQVGNNARACPKCGHRFTGGPVKFLAWFIIAGAVLFGVKAMMNQDGPDIANTPKALAPAISAVASSRAETTPTKSYVIPPEFSLVPTVQRGAQGEIYISGATNFPNGMKMWVILGPKKAQQDAFVLNGEFRSGPLYQGVPTPVTGSQPLEIVAYFNGAWQSKDVLAALGEGVRNFNGKLFKQTDPDVIDSDKILDAKFTVSLPPLAPVSAEANAINIVKHAILTVPDQGRSVTDIEENLKLFMTPGTGVIAGKGWSATAAGANVYNVSFDYNDDGRGERQAIWSVNTATKQVKYVNEAAKLFSWTPSY